MKFIDEKGMLFGKINVIDFLVIIFLFTLLPVFYFGYKLFQKPSTKPKITEITMSIDIYATFKNLNPEIEKLIVAGDRELDNTGMVIGEILEINKIEPNFITIKLNETDTITKEDAQRRQISLKLKLKGAIRDDIIYYKNTKVQFGSEFIFKTNKYEIRGLIIPEPTMIKNKEFLNTIFKQITIDVIFINLSPDVASLISAGDFEVNEKGDTIAKTLKIGSIEPYVYKIDLGDGTYITKIDPQKKQLQAKVEVMGEIIGNAFHFRGKRIALDSMINLKTNKYRIEGVVIKEPIKIESLVQVPLSFDVIFINLSPDVASLISAGDFEVNEKGDTIAKTLKIGSIEPYVYKIDLGDGTYITKIDPQKKQLQAKVEVMGEIIGNAFHFRGKRIALDSMINLKTNKYRIEGVVTKEPVAAKKIEERWVLLKLKFSNLIPELINVIKAGDEQRDSVGNLIAKVDSIVSIEQSKKIIEIVGSGGDLVVANDPLYKDIVLLIKVLCIKTKKDLVFQDSIIKIGNNVSFAMDKYDITGKIIEIKETGN